MATYQAVAAVLIAWALIRLTRTPRGSRTAGRRTPTPAVRAPRCAVTSCTRDQVHRPGATLCLTHLVETQQKRMEAEFDAHVIDALAIANGPSVIDEARRITREAVA